MATSELLQNCKFDPVECLFSIQTEDNKVLCGLTRAMHKLKRRLRLWKEFLLGINPVWSGCIRLLIKELSLPANVLAKTF